MTKQNVFIINKKSNTTLEKQAKLSNIELDKNSGCLIADCELEENNSTILVWKIDNIWQGWIND